MKNIFPIVAIVAMLCFGCKKNNPAPNHVHIVNSGAEGFTPRTLVVEQGTTVTWTNYDRKIHTVTSDFDIFDSGDLKKKQEFSYTFSFTGTFNYHCEHHSAMKGTVIVE